MRSNRETVRDAAKPIGYAAAAATVIASMIGTGVFTTLGYQAQAVPNALALLAVWLLGGLISLCGAVSYAELAARVPRSGGEYSYLREIYHPWLGLLAGVVSVLVGFSAAAALSCIALGRYAATLVAVDPTATALGALTVVAAFHLARVRVAARFQVATTALKLGLIAVFCVAGIAAEPSGLTELRFGPDVTEAMLTPQFGLALLFASYAYSGWNAAVYLSGEVRNAHSALPRALIHGTLLVTAAYLLLNLVFLRVVPFDQLQGTLEIGALAGGAVFGVDGARAVSALLCIALVSSVSAMMLTGPRVLEAIGHDQPSLTWLAQRDRRGAPVRAVLAQAVIAAVLISTDAFVALLSYVGFTLTLFTVLCVAGLFVLRARKPDTASASYRAWGYPVTPALFLLFSTATLVAALWTQPVAAWASIATVLAAAALVRHEARRARRR